MTLTAAVAMSGGTARQVSARAAAGARTASAAAIASSGFIAPFYRSGHRAVVRATLAGVDRGRVALMAVVGAVATGAALWIGSGVVRAGDGSGSAVAGSGGAITGDGGAPQPPNPVIAAVAAGRHLRIDGPRGPIHVWIPPGYHADTGATIIYLHGYYDGVDSAWTGHMLPEQFAMSALNALFIAPESPVAAKTPINYPDLGEVLRIVEDKAGVVRGGALTAVIGLTSGAFRTIDHWLDEPLVDQIIMIDAMYADQDVIRGVVPQLAAPPHDSSSGEETFCCGPRSSPGAMSPRR